MNPGFNPDQAADWAARLDAGPLSRDEAAALTRWLDADPANEGRLDEMQRTFAQVRTVLPGMVAAGRLPVRESRPAWHPGWARATALAAALVLAAVWWVRRPEIYSTPAAHRQTVTLADGSRVELNALTTIRVRLDAHERRVQLEGGEAFFTVAKNPDRPFLVETAAGRVRVTGTIFNVSSYAGQAMAVLLLEGSVDATPAGGGDTLHLMPGHELVIGAGRSELKQLSPAALADAVAWREGRIVFHDTPLATALERFARHHGRAIEVAPAARDLTLGGRFALDDFDGFLRDLPLALPVSVRHEADGRILVERKQPERK